MTYEEKLTELMRENTDLVVLTAENRGPVIYIGEKFPNRFFDIGIAEQSLVGIAAGFAKMGNKPVIHALASFLTMRAFEFIRTDVGLSRLPVKIVGTIPGFLSEANGPTHQAIEDISLMRAIPGINIFCPADENEMVKGLPIVLLDDNPWYVRHNSCRSNYPHEEFVIGKAEVLGEGTNFAIFSYGYMFNEALKLYEIAQQLGVKVRLINMRCLNPYDKEIIIDNVKTCKKIIVIEDHLIKGGLYTIIAETLLEQGLTCKIRAFCLHNYFKPGKISEILAWEKFSAEDIWAFLEKDNF